MSPDDFCAAGTMTLAVERACGLPAIAHEAPDLPFARDVLDRFAAG
jgi:hypothetical protein